MNILVISGGSGNDTLIKGLKKFYPESNVKVLVNAYDAGKSTGICRQVTDTLGVSDIRKNHIRMYKATVQNPNKCFIEFYENRYDFSKGNEVAEICDKLIQWNMKPLIKYVENFFSRIKANDYAYTDFNISNIVYAEMYAEHGYEVTNEYFCKILGIEDFVILNSFDNIFIKAKTASGKIIEEEGDLVEYCNPEDIVVGMTYDFQGTEQVGLNPKAIEAVAEADLIVISTGTFWSSIYPTLHYYDFYTYVNASSAKKVWAINCEQDKDCYGVGSNKFIEFFNNLGLDLEKFTILENLDAHESLRQSNDAFDIVYESMENNNGKHDGEKYARAVLKIFYNLKSLDNYDRIIFDFDDTLWARNSSSDEELLSQSRTNMSLVNELGSLACIISGNSYSSIAQKLSTMYGSSIEDFVVDIWADANSALFRGGKRISVISDLMITGKTDRLIDHFRNVYGIKCVKNDDVYTSCLKIKPLSSLDQALVSNYLNDYLLPASGLGYCVAKPTGKTTVDIVSSLNNKGVVLQNMRVNFNKVLYIGDEIDNGNDQEISTMCNTSIHTNSVFETNALLRLLLNKD